MLIDCLAEQLQNPLIDLLAGLGGGGGGGEASATLDSPVSSAIASDVAVAYGFNRLVQGYSGDTVRLKRLSDNVEANFTFGSNGIFTMTAVNSWRSGANVDVVHFFDQKGGAVNLVASGTVAFVRSDIVKRFGVNYSNQIFSATKTSGSAVITVASTTLMGVGMGVSGSGIPTDSVIDSVDSATQITISQNATASETSNMTVDNGLLARSETLGAVGCDLAGVGHLATGTLTFDATTGAEVSLLYSHNLRKRATNQSSQYGGDAINERLFFYGVNANQYMRARVTGGTVVNIMSVKTSTSHTAQAPSHSLQKKQFAQQVGSFTANATRIGEYSRGALEYSATTTAQGITDIGNGTLSNGKLVVGTEITDSAGNTFSTTQRLNGIFGGVILHKPLSDINRWTVIQKLHQVGQEHLIETTSNLEAMFEDGILHKDIDGTTGTVAGFNGLSNFSFNLPGMGGTVGTPTFTNQYTIPNIGLVGLRSTNDNDNTYISSDAVPPSLNGTIISLNMTESTGNDLTTDLAVHAGTPSSSGTILTTDEFSFGICRDHAEMSAIMRPFDLTQIGTRLYADRTTSFGATVYDQANQLMGKYNRSVGLANMVYGETISGTARTAGNWANQGANSLGLDGAVFAHIAENLKTLSKDNKLVLQIARYQAPAGYNPNDNQATRLPFSLQSDNWLFCAQSTLTDHQEGSVAHNKTGGVVHHKSTAKFQSFHGILQSFSGVRVFWAWTPTVLTDEQVRKIDVNLYKLVA